jgi:broad specificity phosphatase PhoE
MKFYFIRHGRMAGDPHRHYRPPVSGCLSAEGAAQAAALGRALAGITFDHVYASPLGRAIETAQVLTCADGCDIEIKDWLIEWRPAHVVPGGGDAAKFEEMARTAAMERPERMWKTGAGEGALEMAGRLVPGWVDLLAGLGVDAGHGGYLLHDPDDARCVALVAHGGSLGHLLSFVLGVPIRPHPPICFLETGVAVVHLVRMGDVWYPQLEIAAPCRA